jgi:hypothetical protein
MPSSNHEKPFSMEKGTIVYGLFLILLGVASYILTGGVSATALIPAYFGLLVVPMGLLAILKPHAKRHFLHASAALSLLGILGTVKGLVASFTLMNGGEVLRPQAVVAQAVMCVASAVYLSFCVRSFINARVLKKTT